MQSPLVPVPVLLNSQGHFPKYLSSRREIFCPWFCPSDISIKYSICPSFFTF
nr:MAG TPA: hypothetical protein [Caudoviricetes sp.]DAT03337.1 MAG TPA: hypothetical protein [Caudoviricetes sp.]